MEVVPRFFTADFLARDMCYLLACLGALTFCLVHATLPCDVTLSPSNATLFLPILPKSVVCFLGGDYNLTRNIRPESNTVIQGDTNGGKFVMVQMTHLLFMMFSRKKKKTNDKDLLCL